MNYVKIPNLPQNEVTAVIVGSDLSNESEYTLNRMGIACIKAPYHQKLYDAVASHADMLIFHTGSDKFICEPEMKDYFERNICSSNICSGSAIQSKYPYDIAYNAARVGNFLICNRGYTDSKIIDCSIQKELDIINVRQGYAKCNVCVLDEKSIITSDAGIAAAVTSYGISVLFTDDCCVRLKGLNNGFLGGASGKLAPDKLAVNGNIKLHKNCDEIIKFAAKRGIEIISLNNDCIADLGSILPILEK